MLSRYEKAVFIDVFNPLFLDVLLHYTGSTGSKSELFG